MEPSRNNPCRLDFDTRRNYGRQKLSIFWYGNKNFVFYMTFKKSHNKSCWDLSQVVIKEKLANNHDAVLRSNRKIFSLFILCISKLKYLPYENILSITYRRK
jgi:hypothetical protein